MRHTLFVVAVVLFVSGIALAEIPQVMGYQGMITDNSGITVDDDTYTMRFRICTAPTGGTVVWDSGDMSVTTTGGVFSVSLGEAPQPTLDIAFDQDYWMLVTFEGENQTPRKPLGSVGYAYMASGVVPGTEVAGDFYVAGKLGAGTTTPAVGVDVSGSVNTDSLYRIEGDVVLAAPDEVTRVGRGAGASNTSTEGTFVGFDAGLSNTTGPYNTFVGDRAGYSNSTGGANTFLGDRAGYSNTTGSYSTFLGRRAGYSNTTGSDNTFLGLGAGYSNTTGFTNTFLGTAAGFSNTTGYYNTFLGTAAGYYCNTGHSNTLVGRAAGFNSGSAEGCVFLGYQAGFYENSSNRLYIENSDAGPWGALIYGDFDNDLLAFNAQVGIGTTTPAADLHVAGSTVVDDTLTTGTVAIPTGASDGYVLTSDASGVGTWQAAAADGDWTVSGSDMYSAVSGNVGIGTTTPSADLQVAGNAVVDDTLTTDAIAIPTGAADGYVLTSDASGGGTWQAPAAVSDGDWTVSGSDLYSAVSGNVGLGTTSPAVRLDVAGSVNTDSLYRIGGDVVLAAEDSVTRVGRGAGANSTVASGTFVGFEAGLSNTSGYYNTFVGDRAGYSNTTGLSNTFLGRSAGYSNTTGSDNAFLGVQAGYWNGHGASNTFLGRSAGYSNTGGFSNTFLGRSAGYSNTTGFENTFLGVQAGSSNTTGQENTFLGDCAGCRNTTGDGGVFLGSEAGYYETSSNRLYIENSDAGPSDALIYGEFDNDILALNADVGIGTTTPVSELEVNGRIELPDNDATGTTGSGAIEIGNSLRIDGDEIITDADASLYVQSDNNGDLVVDGGTFTVDASENRVGIGTTTPGGKVLHVKGGSSGGTGWSNLYDVVFESDAHSVINLVAHGQWNSDIMFSDTERGRGSIQYKHPEDAMYFGTAGVSDRMHIGSDGSVGIASTSPGGRLQVGALGGYPTVVLDRATGQPSIKSTEGHLICDSNGSAVGLNWYSPDDVVLVNGGGDVGIGTTSPARKLHVSDVMRLEPRSSAPANPSMGDMYMDSGTRRLMVYDGSVWQPCW